MINELFRSDEEPKECLLQHTEGILPHENREALGLLRAIDRDQTTQAAGSFRY